MLHYFRPHTVIPLLLLLLHGAVASAAASPHIINLEPEFVAFWSAAKDKPLEGFATYVSGLLNPTASDGTLLMDNELGKVRLTDRPWLARAFLEVANAPAVDRNGSHAAADWFGAGVHNVRKDLPSRCGYWLGLQVLRELARKHSVVEMVHWNVDTLHGHVLETLKAFAAEAGR